VRIWNAINGEVIQDLETDGRRISALAFSADGALLAAGGEGQEVFVFDHQTGGEPRRMTTNSGRVLSLAFCQAETLAIGDADNDVHFWDVNSLVETGRGVSHEGSVSALVYDAGRETLISGSYDTTIRFWAMAKQKDSGLARQAEAERTER